MLSLICAALLAVSDEPVAVETPAAVSLRFGVYTTDKPLDVYKKFSPALEALQSGVESRLPGVTVEVDLRIYKGYDEAVNALVKGDCDFARFGPASYILASARDKKILLLGMEEKKGMRRFPGHIVVRSDSDIKTLEDLKGRSFAFGDETSTIGRYLSMALMVDAGLHRSDLSRHEFLGRHDKVFQAVALGDFDAGALKDSTFQKMNKVGQLRILHSFENVTKPWIARSGMEPKVARALSESLCGLTDEAALSALGAQIVPATPKEYDFVRKGMKKAKNFVKKKD